MATSSPAMALGSQPPQQMISRILQPRIVSFRNLHTGEVFTGPFKLGTEYIPEAFEKLSHVLRDHRTGDTHAMDPKLLEIMHMIDMKAQQDSGFVVLSGYRSPRTNRMLARNTDGVAENSYHMKGQAIDLRIPGYRTENVKEIARGLGLGGVGFYRGSDFVHLDTGPVRFWS